jgi:pimeloyl-ACP methyl ester carboxylesterase
VRASLLCAGLVLLASCSSSPAATPGEDGEPSSSTASPSDTASSAGAEAAIAGSFSVAGRELYLSCTGSGSPTIMLEAGEGVPADAMDPIRSAYDAKLRVCSYDRANTGQSDAAPTPRSGADVVGDLHGLLDAADVPGPYVLVGHSAGGLFVQAYARRYPKDVVGVVAMNPVPPWPEWSARALPEMTPPERADETAYYEGQNGEGFDYQSASTLLESRPVPHAMAFHMLISTIAQCDSPKDVCGRTYPAYESILRSVVKEWPQGAFSQAESGHEIYLDKPEAVTAAIDDVLDRAGG